MYLILNRVFISCAGGSSQCSYVQSEKRRERSQGGLRSRIYSKIPLIAPHKNLPENMSRVPLMASNSSAPEVADRRNTVLLEAGLPGDSWTYCVERERLARRSEWFRAMLTGPLAPPVADSPPLLRLQHVDKRAFDHFLRYLHDEPVNFISVSTARATLDAAHQYLCPELARLAAAYLGKKLTESTVLEIYQGLGLYASDTSPVSDRPSHSPSAPLPPGDEADEIAAVCTDLLLKCLFVIDSNPVTVLRQEHFEELNVQEVAQLARRDTLNLSSECVLFSALDRWAAAECRRQGLEPLPFNKRAVLSDDICFSVRYLLMNDQEFVSGPMASGILTNEECVHIVSRILRHPESSADSNVRGASAVHPSMLSDTPRIGRYKCDGLDCNMLKPGKKERQDNRKNRRKECASQGQRTCARIGNCLIQVLSCVFD
ncbi:BTB/POZ domain-containing protein 6-B-like [Odontomachus brunneus]|uniref:BTB/POZ domain-containing protein 6-B-like n=1 Tax=Odontomachus brunneus TaxID=486640 RepID=UPI0013F22A7D|nr:BTB/POZ domain-containing protein 6-B-like [Odontomachus brunneus]